jgi:hypothetical protein
MDVTKIFNLVFGLIIGAMGGLIIFAITDLILTGIYELIKFIIISIFFRD